jgi:DNA-binding NtrC family response regulator
VPVRERRDDILLLVESFLADLATNIGRPAAGLSEDAKDRLLAYAWPGNVRELRNAIERAVILCEGGLISSEHCRSRSARREHRRRPSPWPRVLRYRRAMPPPLVHPAD